MNWQSDYPPGPVPPDILDELTAVAENHGANILHIPDTTLVTLDLVGPAVVILARAYDYEAQPE